MEFPFRAQVWLYEGDTAAWHFMTVPTALSHKIKQLAAGSIRAWGSVRVTVLLGTSRWKTSLFWDTKRDAYLLPVKAQIRAREHLRAEDVAEVVLMLDGSSSEAKERPHTARPRRTTKAVK